MVTGTKFRVGRSRGFWRLRARKFEPVTTFAEPAIFYNRTPDIRAMARAFVSVVIPGFRR